MYWDLALNKVHPLMFPGKDDKLKDSLFTKLLSDNKDNKCLQVGVPSWKESKIGDNFTSLDLYDKRPCIDMQEDLSDTSFLDNTFDLIVCNAILEHVIDPFACSKEMYRICKPNGFVWVEIPFVQPYHPTKKQWEESDGLLVDHLSNPIDDQEHGGDYWRFTPQGICQLMKPFKMVELLLVSDGGVTFYGEKV